MAEPTPGRPGGQGNSGPRSATAATFVVNDASLREMRKTWQGLTQDVKNFGTALSDLRRHERDLDRLGQKLGALGVGGGSGGGSGIGVGGRNPHMPPKPVGFGAIGASLPSGAQQLPVVATASSTAQQGTAGTGGGGMSWRKAAGGAAVGFVGASTAYFRPRMDGMSDNDLLFNMLGRAQGGGYSANRRRDELNAVLGAGGFQSAADLNQGVSTVTRAVGGTATTGRSAQLLRQSGQLASLVPNAGLEGSTAAVSSLYTAQSSNRLATIGASSIGVGGNLRSPTQVYDQVLRATFGTQKLTAAMINEGMVPGAPLARNLDYYLPDPNAQEQFRQYALAKANLGGSSELANRAITTAARLASGQDVDKVGNADRRNMERAGLSDNIRSAQNRLGQQTTINSTKITEASRGGIIQGFEGLADATERLTDTLLGLDKQVNKLVPGAGSPLDAAGLAGVLGTPGANALQAVGGIGGALYAAQGARSLLGGRFRLPGIGGAARGLGGAAGALGRGALGAGAAALGGVTAAGAGIAAAAGVGVAGIVGGARADRSDGFFSERAWKTAYERGLGELHGYDSGYAAGGEVRGNHSRDDVAIRATPGELVVPLPVVGRYGGAKKLMSMLGFSGEGHGGHYAKGGEVGLSPDKDQSHLSGLSGDFLSRLRAFAAGVGQDITIFSGYRSPERQAQLFDAAVKKYGSEAAARKWVAPPGRSNHGRGMAADLVQRWGGTALGEAAKKYGLHFPMSHEPWHIEPFGAGGAGAQSSAGAGAGSSSSLATEPPPSASGFGGFGSMGGGGNYASEAEALSAILGGSGLTGSPGGLGRRSAGATSTTAPAAAASGSGAVALGQQMAAGRGWTGGEWDALYRLWEKESGWNPNAANPRSSARGIPQAMMSAHFGANWEKNPEAQKYLSDPATQIGWGLNYIAGRYQMPSKAWAHSQRLGWYEQGSWELKNDEVAQLHRGEMVVPARHARKMRSMLATSGQQPGADTMSTAATGSRATVTLHIQAPVTVVGRATPADARSFLEMVKTEAERESTLDFIGMGG